MPLDGRSNRRPAPRTAPPGTAACTRRSRRAQYTLTGKNRRRDGQGLCRREALVDARRRQVLLVLHRAASTMRPPRPWTRSSSRIRFPTTIDFTAVVRSIRQRELELAADDAVREEHRHRRFEWRSARPSRTRAAGTFAGGAGRRVRSTPSRDPAHATSSPARQCRSRGPCLHGQRSRGDMRLDGRPRTSRRSTTRRIAK